MSKVRVTFLIDREEKRVVCAEAGGDFVDVLFSFLTLPLGSIVQLLGKQSGLGSLDSLYRSVEKLDMKHLQTAACKEMLLNPRSAAAITCEDHSQERKCGCPNCGGLMHTSSFYTKNISECGGIFVNETVNFFITDNLRVIPTSLKGACSLLEELQIKDSSMIEKKVIDFGLQETLSLLRKLFVYKNPLTEFCFPGSCLVSKNPLTEVFFPDVRMQAGVKCSSTIKKELNVNKEREITLNLILDRKTNSVLYAEVGAEFVNQLLSFLTFPLGSVLKLLSNNISQLGSCINNLYSSVKNMGSDCFKSGSCRDLLLFPKLATFYGIEKQILNIEELAPKKLYSSNACIICNYDKLNKPCSFVGCQHEVRLLDYTEQNPKSRKLMTNIGGAFAVESTRFMIADNLLISPLSFISAINDETKFPISGLLEKKVCLDKAKTLTLLSTMLISKTVLTDVFMHQTRED